MVPQVLYTQVFLLLPGYQGTWSGEGDSEREEEPGSMEISLSVPLGLCVCLAVLMEVLNPSQFVPSPCVF